VDRLIGFIFRHNTESLSLFRKSGFSVWGELPGVTELDGVERDVIIVGRALKSIHHEDTKSTKETRKQSK
jgi:phosphinothricin acetyltransferase